MRIFLACIMMLVGTNAIAKPKLRKAAQKVRKITQRTTILRGHQTTQVQNPPRTLLVVMQVLSAQRFVAPILREVSRTLQNDIFVTFVPLSIVKKKWTGYGKKVLSRCQAKAPCMQRILKRSFPQAEKAVILGIGGLDTTFLIAYYILDLKTGKMQQKSLTYNDLKELYSTKFSPKTVLKGFLGSRTQVQLAGEFPEKYNVGCYKRNSSNFPVWSKKEGKSILVHTSVAVTCQLYAKGYTSFVFHLKPQVSGKYMIRVYMNRVFKVVVIPPVPIYKKPWFWGVVAGGVAIVATGVTLGVVLSQQNAQQPQVVLPLQ